MTRRTLSIVIASACLAMACSARATGQDVEFIRALEAAQRERPATIASSARIAPESEPGTPLVVRGRAFAADGKTPLAGAVVFAYHTDRGGVYDRAGAPPHSWRLKGWAMTGGDGRFEFRTMRPGPYPGSRNAAHIHVMLFTPDGGRYHAGEVLFEDDPFVTAENRGATQRDAVFGPVRPVRREGGVEHVEFNTRVVPSQKF